MVFSIENSRDGRDEPIPLIIIFVTGPNTDIFRPFEKNVHCNHLFELLMRMGMGHGPIRLETCYSMCV